MAIKISSSIVVNNSRDVTIGGLTADPGSVSAGAIHFNRGLGVVRGWNGSTWTTLTQGAGTTSAWAWGRNIEGQLGYDTFGGMTSPVAGAISTITDWVQLSAGDFHSAGIRDNDSVWTWGYNYQGQLGINNAASRSSPVSVVGGFSDWAQVSAGRFFTIGLRSNGSAWAWGKNNLGQLGNNSVVYQSSPTSVVGIADWIQISSGGYQAVAIRSNGSAWAWGKNNVGQLGDLTTIYRSSPVSVVGGYTDWVQISAGLYHNIGLRLNGTAWTWGSNFNGQLGTGETLSVSRSSPASVVGVSDWIHVSTGWNHSLGIRSVGTALAWGQNTDGQLGLSLALADRSSPTSVVGGFTDWVWIDGGQHSSAAIRANGGAWCWGAGLWGELGSGAASNRSSPVSVLGGYTDWVQVSMGNSHALGLRAS